MRILVVYYSLTGNTKKIGEEITKRLNAEIEEIIDKKKRTGFLGFLRSGYEALFKRMTDIETTSKNHNEYDLIIVGSPVWAGSLSSPVRTYLSLYKDKMKNLAFFATYGMSQGKVFKQMEEISKSPIKTFGISEKEIKSGVYSGRVEEFTKELLEIIKS